MEKEFFKTELTKALKVDSLDLAERVTGKSYKSDDLTSALGLQIMMENNAHKQTLLIASGDSYYGMKYEEYISIVKNIGFELIFNKKFKSERHQCEDQQFTFFHKGLGVLLDFDTFNVKRVNGSKIYYNWNFGNTENWYDYRSSGHGYGYGKHGDTHIWIGDHDGREALIHNLNGLIEHGTLMPKWVERPFLWLLNYSDTEDKNYDYKKINEENISKFPKYVQEAISCQ